jgi:hypothetical protein
MNFLRALLGGMIGAIIGAAVWAAIAYFLHFNVGIIAWGIGALAGYGALKLSSGDDHNTTGAAAVLAAVLGVLGGKYATASILVSGFMGQVATITPQSCTDEDLVVILAEEELDAIEAADQTHLLKWPKGKDRGNAEYAEDYPENVAKKAKQKLVQMKPDEKEALKQRIASELNALTQTGQTSLTFNIFLHMFTIFDLLWFILAAVTSWKIGAQDDTQ